MKSLSLSRPHMIIVVGIPGSGKSYFATKFAETFHAPVVSYDTISTLTDCAPAAAAKVAYYQIDELLKTRQSVIIDGLTDTRAERTELNKRATKADYETLYIWVQTDPGTAKMRATTTKNGTKARSSADYDRQLKRFVEPTTLEKAMVISGKHTYATQARVVLKKLSAPRAEISTHDLPPLREPHSRRNIIVR